MLGVGLTGLMASFMSGMAGNVTAFNTVFTYDIYQTHIRPGAARPPLPDGGPHHDRGGRGALHRHGLPGAVVQQHQRPAAAGLQLRQRAAVRHLPAGHVLEARPRGHGAFCGLLSGTVAAALTHGCTVAEGKGGWITTIYEFPSSMAQNFWIAIMAWTTCFVVTILVSLVTRPRPEKELHGLVYGLTELKHDEGVSWYKRPVPLAIAIAALALISEFLVRLTCWIYECLRAFSSPSSA